MIITLITNDFFCHYSINNMSNNFNNIIWFYIEYCFDLQMCICNRTYHHNTFNFIIFSKRSQPIVLFLKKLYIFYILRKSIFNIGNPLFSAFNQLLFQIFFFFSQLISYSLFKLACFRIYLLIQTFS